MYVEILYIYIDNNYRILNSRNVVKKVSSAICARIFHCVIPVKLNYIFE